MPIIDKAVKIMFQERSGVYIFGLAKRFYALTEWKLIIMSVLLRWSQEEIESSLSDALTEWKLITMSVLLHWSQEEIESSLSDSRPSTNESDTETRPRHSICRLKSRM